MRLPLLTRYQKTLHTYIIETQVIPVGGQSRNKGGTRKYKEQGYGIEISAVLSYQRMTIMKAGARIQRGNSNKMKTQTKAVNPSHWKQEQPAIINLEGVVAIIAGSFAWGHLSSFDCHKLAGSSRVELGCDVLWSLADYRRLLNHTSMFQN